MINCLFWSILKVVYVFGSFAGDTHCLVYILQSTLLSSLQNLESIVLSTKDKESYRCFLPKMRKSNGVCKSGLSLLRNFVTGRCLKAHFPFIGDSQIALDTLFKICM